MATLGPSLGSTLPPSTRDRPGQGEGRAMRMMQRFRRAKHATEAPPPAIASDSGTGLETVRHLADAAQTLGQEFGAARMPQDEALGSAAAPNRYIAGLVGARKAMVTRDELRRGIGAAQRATTVEARKAEAKERFRLLGQKLMRIEVTFLRRATADVERARLKVDEA